MSTLGFAQELKPTDTLALVTFIVTDYNEVPEEGAYVKISGIDTVLTKEGTADIQGRVVMLLPEGKKYKRLVKKFDLDFDFDESKPFSLPAMPGPIVMESILKIRVVKSYLRTYNLDHVYFDTNKWDIKSESLKAIKTLIKAMESNPKMRVEIAGHTDNVGDDKSNMTLSQRRADAVVKYVLDNGIAQNRILAKGYGEIMPLASNDEDSGRQKNRRTEVRVIEE
jgi:flagellar motor protein MotB